MLLMGLICVANQLTGYAPGDIAKRLGQLNEFSIYKEATGATADFIIALEHDAWDDAKTALAAGANINFQDNFDGSTPLINLSQVAAIPKIKFLLDQKGIDVNAKNRDGETALIKAVNAGHLEAVKLLIPKSDVDTRGGGGMTALMYALQHTMSICSSAPTISNYQSFIKSIQESSLKIIQALFPISNIKLKDNDDRTILMYVAGACARNNKDFMDYQDFMAKFLKAHGADPKAIDKNGETALMLAAASNNAAMVTYLLPLSDPKHSDNKGQNALMHAGINDPYEVNSDVVRLLIPASDINATDHEGKTALDLIAEKESPDPHTPEKGVRESVKLLEAAGAKMTISILDAQTKDLWTGLRKGDLEEVQKAIALKADVNAINKNYERTPLTYAIQTASMDIDNQNFYASFKSIIAALIKAKADVNKIDEQGEFPLFLALRHISLIEMREQYSGSPMSEQEKKDFVGTLIQAGADVNRIVKGQTSLSYAIEEIKNQKLLADIVNMLLKAKADPNIFAREKVKVVIGTGGAEMEYPAGFNAPLAQAIRAHDKNIVKMLIDAGAKVEDFGIMKPLVLAARYAAYSDPNNEIFALLLAKGADINKELIPGAAEEMSEWGFEHSNVPISPLGAIVGSVHSDPIIIEKVKFLLAHGAQVTPNVWKLFKEVPKKWKNGLRAELIPQIETNYNSIEKLLQEAEAKQKGETEKHQG